MNILFKEIAGVKICDNELIIESSSSVISSFSFRVSFNDISDIDDFRNIIDGACEVIKQQMLKRK